MLSECVQPNLLAQITHYWDYRAESYSQANLEELHCYKQAAWLKVILTHAPQQQVPLNVLDVGTGPGFFAILMALAGHRVTAIDATPNMLQEAKRNAQRYKVNIEFVQHDVHTLPFADHRFDLVLSRNVTWNLKSPEQAYAEWYRVLKPQGRLLNFDANWYLYLFDEAYRHGFQQDRANTQRLHMNDHYANPKTKIMEDIARDLPLSRQLRPQWDERVLRALGCSHIHMETDIGEQLWDAEEKVNYQSTPMFMLVAHK